MATLRDTYLSVDLRWLGIFRIAYGCSLLVELARRWPGLRLYYTDAGILPSAFAKLHAPSRHLYSIYFACSSAWSVELAFGLTLLCFSSFTLGYRSRLFHALSLVCITSLDSRNVLLENDGATLVNLLGAWTLFLPLGKRFSVDALLESLRQQSEASSDALNDRSRPGCSSAPYRSLAVLGLLLQWSGIYFCQFAQQNGPSWRDGTAIHWILAQNCSVTAFGVWCRARLSPLLLATLTRACVRSEVCLSLLLLLPIWRRQARLIGLLLALSLHGAIVATARLGPFSYLMVLGFLIHLSADDLAFLSRWFGRRSRARTVLYDSDCGICLYICRVLKRLDPLGRLTFLGNDERDRLPAGIDSALLERSLVVILPNGDFVSEGRAVFEVLRAVPFGISFGWWLRVPGLAELGNALYRLVASHRAEISSGLGLAACGVPPRAEPPRTEPLRAANPAMSRARPRAFIARALHETLAAVFLSALATRALLDNRWQRVHVQRPHWVASVLGTARLFEQWSPFAPEPAHEDGHLVVDALTRDGRRIDPFTGKAPVLDPISETGWGHEKLWCDYTNIIRLPSGTPYRPLLGAYLGRWQELTGRPEDALASADVWWVRSNSPRPGERRGSALPPQLLISLGSGNAAAR